MPVFFVFLSFYYVLFFKVLENDSLSLYLWLLLHGLLLLRLQLEWLHLFLRFFHVWVDMEEIGDDSIRKEREGRYFDWMFRLCLDCRLKEGLLLLIFLLWLESSFKAYCCWCWDDVDVVGLPKWYEMWCDVMTEASVRIGKGLSSVCDTEVEGSSLEKKRNFRSSSA